MTLRNIIIICGPTASGKTDFAYNIAQRIGGVIINADSMQIYEDAPIITASPDLEQYEAAPHFLYNYLSARYKFTVVNYIKDVQLTIDNLASTPIIVGGTGLYINALINGFSAIPDISESEQYKIRHYCNDQGVEEIYQQLQSHGCAMAERLRPNDRQRVFRAYEVMTLTGKSMAY